MKHRIPSKILVILQISWFGRLSVFKMNLLPKLLYCFKVLTVEIPSYILHLLRRRIERFVWGDTRPRVNRSTHCCHKCNGQLGGLLFFSYYKGTHIASLAPLHASHEVFV